MHLFSSVTNTCQRRVNANPSLRNDSMYIHVWAQKHHARCSTITMSSATPVAARDRLTGRVYSVVTPRSGRRRRWNDDWQRQSKLSLPQWSGCSTERVHYGPRAHHLRELTPIDSAASPPATASSQTPPHCSWITFTQPLRGGATAGLTWNP